MPEIPKAAKKPADRKAPDTKPAETIDVEVRGVALSLPREALDDFELLDDLDQLEQGNPARLPSVLRRLVGDQWREVMDALRGESGRVSVEDGAGFVAEVMEAVSPNS